MQFLSYSSLLIVCLLIKSTLAKIILEETIISESDLNYYSSTDELYDLDYDLKAKHSPKRFYYFK